MNSTATKTRSGSALSIQYIGMTAIAVFLTFLLHEFSHWLMGELLGEKMGMNLNAAYPLGGGYQQKWHATPITVAGPAFTLLQAAGVFYVMKVKENILLYPFLLTPLIMRILAGVMNIINPNDEGRISVALGLNLFVVPILVCAALFYLVLKAPAQYRTNFRFNALNVLLIIFFSSVLILSNQYLTN